MKSDLPLRPTLVDRLNVPIDPALKRKVFEQAATKGVSVSALVRQGLSLVVEAA